MRKNVLLIRRSYKIKGIVQGVGFRPFVYRLAHELELTGWARNSPTGVEIELQGVTQALELFEHSLSNNAPPLAVISSISANDIPVIDETLFSILPSSDGESDIQIAPDSALCDECLQELFDPKNRRYRYPFITCTNCGPRYSIITGTPYDRPNTTMAGFPLCPDCLREYQDPLDRRFHAQPIACHVCGPQVTLMTSGGDKVAVRDDAVNQAVALLKNGAILAVKGIGGYHLAVDACNQNAVQRLRERKKRDEKPFAVMVADLEAARTLTRMDTMEERLHSSPEAPIVIVRKQPDTVLSPLIAPNNGWLGLMLPYAPLHHLLMRDNFKALVMTSGNVSDEPVAYQDDDALKRLTGIADYFLVHDRPIHVRSDDSVIRVFQGAPLFYRRARGYAPRAVTLPFAVGPLLAVGAELKSALCLAKGNKAFVSQHIGDLQNQSTLDSFSGTVEHLSGILAIKPEVVVSDLHPDYLSTRFAENTGLSLIRVQHHHAHLAACMAENGLDGSVIGVVFDGTGYGVNGAIWGGEFFEGGYNDCKRAAHFRQLPLPGGDAAVREPWRMAVSCLYQAMGDEAFKIDHPVFRQLPESEMKLFTQMLRRGINSPLTSSCGRLFDAVAALLNLRYKVSYDGQAAIELEALSEYGESSGEYRYTMLTPGDAPLQLDFSPMFVEILSDLERGISACDIAHRFHRSIASASTEICLSIAESGGHDRVLFSGGVFQNRLLTEMLYNGLTSCGLKVFTHRLTPPNDGCIALGQAAVAGWRTVKRG
ncbi:MAG: carbamoyltransferase HypF [Desulfuromonadaceae bacterium]|nr:carbamoyltransferase HypF [Desulfuromonadaceae bacterium]MDD2856618.1 carbamoyltransferase HypF [Desulfuromonadaceae bacterium]